MTDLRHNFTRNPDTAPAAEMQPWEPDEPECTIEGMRRGGRLFIAVVAFWAGVMAAAICAGVA